MVLGNSPGGAAPQLVLVAPHLFAYDVFIGVPFEVGRIDDVLLSRVAARLLNWGKTAVCSCPKTAGQVPSSVRQALASKAAQISMRSRPDDSLASEACLARMRQAATLGLRRLR